jgi:hypothetical protein
VLAEMAYNQVLLAQQLIMQAVAQVVVTMALV